MRRAYALAFALAAFGACIAGARAASAEQAPAALHAPKVDKPWCGPDVTELSDHVCFSDGGQKPGAPRTLVVYLHGMLATNPGFQYAQQTMMAKQAKLHGFAVLIPTSPLGEYGYFWPSGSGQKEKEAKVIEGLVAARAALEARLGPFDETFVVGFSSGAYYASALAVRGSLDVDGYVVLAGGSSWMRPADPAAKRAPVYVGVSAKDRQTADHSRAFAGTLAALRWPYRVEELPVGHNVDTTFMTRGIAYLRDKARAARDARSPAPGAP